MKKRTPPKRSSLFLVEITIAILFFAMASSVCLQLFAVSALKADEATDLNAAVLEASSAAECYRCTEGDLKQTASLLLHDTNLGEKTALDANRSVQTDTSISVYYDDTWNIAQKADASFLMRIQQVSEESGLSTAKITVYRLSSYASHNDSVEELIYQLTIKAYESPGKETM